MSRCKKLIFAAAGVVMFLGLLEISLQSAGALVSWLRKPELRPGAKIILCMGDSHTYGVFVSKDEAYPAKLEKLLRGAGRNYQVLNLGAPGQNSTQILEALPGAIRDCHPQALILMVGVNNGWNTAGQEKTLLQKILNRSKLYKLGRIIYFHKVAEKKSYMVVRRRESAELIYNTERSEMPTDSAALREIQRLYLRDMSSIAAICRENRVELVLMTYAGDAETNYATVNKHMEQVAQRLNLPLVDNYSYFMGKLYAPDGKLNETIHRELFLKDMHLKPLGYDWVAFNLLQVLVQQGYIQ